MLYFAARASATYVCTRQPAERTAAEAAASASRACCAAINTLRGSFRGMSQSMVPPTDSADASELSSSDCSSAHARNPLIWTATRQYTNARALVCCHGPWIKTL